MTTDQKWEDLYQELLDFQNSPLYKFRTQNNYQPVLGQGNRNADIVFVGEAPGKKEAETGRPFCGAAGKILDELLDSINLNRKDIYITNLVNDRPPHNRDPKPQEIELYKPFLFRQLQMIQSKVLVPLGRHSTQHIFEYFGLQEKLMPQGQIHGQCFSPSVDFGNFQIIPLYHPATALYNRSLLPDMQKDFKYLKKVCP